MAIAASAGDRVELPADAGPPTGRYANPDLLPVPVARRTWTTYNFSALWVGMVHNIPSWTLASGLVALGMDCSVVLMRTARPREVAV